MAQYNEAITDDLGIVEGNIFEATFFLTDTLGIDDTQSLQSIFNLLETIGIDETIDTLIKGNINLTDNVGLNDAFNFTIDLIATDQLGLQDLSTAYKSNAVLLADALVMADVASNRLKAMNVLTSIVGIVELLERGFPGTLLEQIGISEDIVEKLNAAGITTATLGAQDVLTYNVAVYLEVSEILGNTDDILFGQKVQALLEEGFIFTTTILGPGTAVYTGWVMNSENMAVSTYNNYAFTDMAKINGKYYGVKEDGLFLLDGNTDDTVFIQSIIRSAKMSLGTSNLKTITQAYLGFRADGSPVLKMVTDEKDETWYTVSETRTDLHTRRIRLAKGQIGRYWQFEIVTTDSTKLELDSVELFPITFKRKV